MATEQWHLDKRVPIAIIGALVCQSLVFVYVGSAWKTDVESRLAVLEKTQDNTKGQESRIIVLEQVVIRIRDDIAEIKSMLRTIKNGQPTESINPAP